MNQQKSSKMSFAIPSLITLLRLFAAPVFYYTFLNHSCVIAFSVFVFAALTDVLDGFAARKLNAASNRGAFFDVFVDFFLIVIVFLAFLRKDWYCCFILVPILASFICFIVSSGTKKPVYDPVGKYMGTFIMIAITITLLFPHIIVRKLITYSLAVFCAISLVSRVKYLIK